MVELVLELGCVVVSVAMPEVVPVEPVVLLGLVVDVSEATEELRSVELVLLGSVLLVLAVELLGDVLEVLVSVDAVAPVLELVDP